MVDAQLLEILCCPETKQDVSLASAGLIETLNGQVGSGTLKNRGGETVKEKLDAGLIRSDKKFLYPVREDIPVMLIDEAISVEGLA